MTSDSFRSLHVESRDTVREVILRGPGKGNAMGPDFWREIPEAFAAMDADPAVRAIVITGSGDHFSYGLDLPAMAGELGGHLTGPGRARERTLLLSWIERLQGSFHAVASCKKPVIAAVSGWCIGGGLDLVSACDVRLCDSSAQFSLREVKVAMVADLGSLQRLPAIIGEGATRELAFTGKNIDAARALRLGLVSDVLPSKDALLAAARGMADEIAANPPLVVQGVKRVMNQSLLPRVQAGLDTVALWNSAFLASKDLEEAIAAFMERRAPTFTGE